MTTSINLPPESTKERFIPISRQEIIQDLLASPHWQPSEQKLFGEFCTLFNALYHFKFHQHLEALKRCYFPFNPDADIITKLEYSPEEKDQLHQQLVEDTRNLLNHANYDELTIEAVNQALTEESPYGVSVSIDLDDFATLFIFYRGSATKIEYRRRWTSLFLRREPLETPIYKRLFIMAKFKTTEERVLEVTRQLQEQHETWTLEKAIKKARKQVKQSRQNLPDDDDAVNDKVFIKLFKNIPRSDLDTLFPNQDVRLKLFDKIKLALTGGGGTVGGTVGIFFKLTETVINPFALAGAFVGLIGVIVRIVMGIFQQRTKYMMILSRNLYFLTLDNNQGVLSSLIDGAEEEEGKEAMLAYHFLHTHATKDYTQPSLDQEIENYLQQQYKVAIDFEVDDGLRKLREEGLLIEPEGGILKVVPPAEANKILDKQWDELFQYHQPHLEEKA